MILAAVLAFAGATPAVADAKSHPIHGWFNCSGSKVNYKPLHFFTQTGNSLAVHITWLPGYEWKSGGIKQSRYGMDLGAKVFKSNNTLEKTWPEKGFDPVTRYQTLIPAGKYIKDTRFRFYGSMVTNKVGTCYNYWEGNAKY